ncbi:J domain-containing protein [Entamoeba marina]
MEEKFKFDDQMFLIFFTGLVGIVILALVLYFIKKRSYIPQTFPCKCGHCEEKRLRLRNKSKKFTTSTFFQLLFTGVLMIVFVKGIITINNSGINAPEPSFNPYALLEIPTTASEKDIRSSYRKMSLKYHPDKNKEEGAEEMFIEITKAYETLTDPKKFKTWKETGRNEEERLEKGGIGLPMWLILDKNRNFILVVYLGVIIVGFPVIVWLLLRRCKKLDNNNLSMDTNGIFSQLIPNCLNFPSMIEVLSLSEELMNLVKIKPDDQAFLPVVQKKCLEEFIKKPKYNIPNAIKTQILIAAHLSRIHDQLPEYLKDDLDEILQLTPTILHGMCTVLMQTRNIPGLWQCIRLNAMITQAVNYTDEFSQLPDFYVNDKKLFTKNMNLKKIISLSGDQRIDLINEKIVSCEQPKHQKVIAPKKEKAEIKKASLENIKKKVQHDLDEKKKKLQLQKKPQSSTVVKDTKQQKKTTDDKVVNDQKKDDDLNVNEVDQTIEKDTKLQERRQNIINFLRYHPFNITFIVRALSVTGTRKVVAGVPISIIINGYRYPTDSKGDRKEDIPDEVDEDNSESEEDKDIPDVEIEHGPNEDVYVHNPYCSNNRLERWWFIVTDVKSNLVINATHGYIPISELPFITKVYIPSPKEPGTYYCTLHIICDSYVGVEFKQNIKFDIIERPTRVNKQEEEEMNEVIDSESESEESESESSEDD